MRTLRIALALVLAAACGGDGPTAPTGVDTPDGAQFVTADLANFWAAYDVGGKDGSATAFQQGYLDKASPGLKDFIGARNLTAASLAQMVRAYPRYFADIRANNLQLASDPATLRRVRDGYVRMEALYPEAVFPPVTFLVGRFSTGGTVSTSGMLIGTEFFSRGPATPVDELGRFQRDNVQSLDGLPLIIAHEHVHILQRRAAVRSSPSATLLEQSLIEGIADFAGERASGGNPNERIKQWALPREAAIWKDFQVDMRGTNVSRWLYNQGSSTATADWPGDLGYFVGYRIAEAFYARAADKRAALKEIIEMRDAEDLLRRSGYTP
jgi:hypothetical protein